MTTNNAMIDIRFDYPNGGNDIYGHKINSSAQINPLLDHLKSVGYNTVTFTVDAPLDLSTGSINLGNPTNGTNRALPADLWKEVAYAKGLGLAVNIQICPAVCFKADGSFVDGDVNLNSTHTLGSGVTLTKVFNSIAAYEATIAQLAEQNHVDGIYVGSNNYGLDQSNNLSQWQTVINSVKSVFTGKVIYEASYNTPVWNLVDKISYAIAPTIATTNSSSVADIISAYYHTVNKTLPGNTNYIDSIINLAHQYNKPILLDDYSQHAGSTSVGTNFDSFSAVMNGNTTDLLSLPQPNARVQSLAFNSFLYVANNLLKGVVEGGGVDEYAPWTLMSWIQNPQNDNGRLWNLMVKDGSNLWNNTAVETGINQVINGSLLENHFFSTPGSDVIIGKNNVVNTAVFYSSLTSTNITKTSTGLTVSSSTDGVDTLTNIQRLDFSDKIVAFDTGLGQTAGEAYRLYTAAFHRTPDATGLGYWIDRIDRGTSLHDVANGFVNSPEFQTLYGANSTNDVFVNALYQNVLHRSPDQEGYNYWMNSLAHGGNRADTLINFSESPENIGQTTPLIAQGIHYDQYLG